MTIILDLDYTLLDTARLKEALFEAIAACGPSREEVEASYTDIVRRPGVVYDYDPDLQIEALGPSLKCDAAEARKKIEAVAGRSREFLYPGAIGFLSRLRSSGAKLILLTLGNEKWQRMKIEKSGLAEYFDRILTTARDKTESVAALSDDPETVVVNDNGEEIRAMQAAAPAFRYIVKRGPKGLPYGLDAQVCDSFDELSRALGV